MAFAIEQGAIMFNSFGKWNISGGIRFFSFSHKGGNLLGRRRRFFLVFSPPLARKGILFVWNIGVAYAVYAMEWIRS